MNAEELSRLALRLAGQALAEQVRALQRYGDLVNQIASGALDQRTVVDEATRFAREETARYLREVTSLGLRHQGALLELERARNDRFFAAVTGRADQAPATLGVPRRVELTLAGALGQATSAAFVIGNSRGAPASVSFVVSDFVGPPANPPFRPPLEIAPATFTLAPGEEQTVRLRLSLTPQLFAAGGEYHATVTVRGYEELELVLLTRVEDARQPEPASGSKSSAASSASSPGDSDSSQG